MRPRRLRHPRHPRRRRRRRRLRYPCRLNITGHFQSCLHRRRQVSSPLTARLVFASCRWWRRRFAGADASPHNRPVITLLPLRRRRGARHGTTISLGQILVVPHCILRHIE